MAFGQAEIRRHLHDRLGKKMAGSTITIGLRTNPQPESAKVTAARTTGDNDNLFMTFLLVKIFKLLRFRSCHVVPITVPARVYELSLNSGGPLFRDAR